MDNQAPTYAKHLEKLQGLALDNLSLNDGLEGVTECVSREIEGGDPKLAAQLAWAAIGLAQKHGQVAREIMDVLQKMPVEEVADVQG